MPYCFVKLLNCDIYFWFCILFISVERIFFFFFTLNLKCLRKKCFNMLLCGKEKRVFLQQWKNLWPLRRSGCNFVFIFTFLPITETCFIHTLEDYSPIYPSDVVLHYLCSDFFHSHLSSDKNQAINAKINYNLEKYFMSLEIPRFS